MLCSSVRRAMSSASSSIETPALMRRTFAWDEHQLVEGNVARGAERDFLKRTGHVTISATGAESFSLGSKPVTKTGAALFLSADRLPETKSESRKASTPVPFPAIVSPRW